MPNETEAVGQPVKLADLFSKCSQLTAQEERQMERIVGTIVPLLEYADQPIVLKPESMGDSFRKFSSVSLRPGAVVVMTDSNGEVESKPLAKFNTSDSLAIIRESFPELQRLVSEKKRASQVRPILSMKVCLGGQRHVFDTRTYRLIISNSGGDCRGLGVSVEMPGGETRPYLPRDLSRGGKIELAIAALKELEGTERLKFGFDCKDVDGREFGGEETLPLEGDRWQETPLNRKVPKP